MANVPGLLKHNGILVHYTTYPEGSVERAKALGLNLWSTYKSVEATVGLWETECQIVAKEEAWKPLGLKSQGDYIAAITGKSSSDVKQELFDRADAIKDPQKRGRKPKEEIANNVSKLRSKGNDTEYTLRRLARDHEDIFTKVKLGALTVNAAAIAAGIRKKPSHNDTALKAFMRAQDRVGLLREILSAFISEGGQQALYEVQAAVEGLRNESPKKKATKGVRIDSGPLEATDKFEQVPKDKWRTLMRVKRDFLARRVAYDCRCLIEFCEEAELAYSDCGFKSAAEMIQQGYELDKEQVEIALAWLYRAKQTFGQSCDTTAVEGILRSMKESP